MFSGLAILFKSPLGNPLARVATMAYVHGWRWPFNLKDSVALVALSNDHCTATKPAYVPINCHSSCRCFLYSLTECRSQFLSVSLSLTRLLLTPRLLIFLKRLAAQRERVEGYKRRQFLEFFLE